MSFQPGAMLYTQGFGSRPEGVEVPNIADYAPTAQNTTGPSGVFPIGKRWVYVDNAEYTLVGLSTIGGVLSATWNLLGTDTGPLNTLTGDSGGAISPSAGNINILGTSAQVVTTGSGHTITASLPSAIITPGSLTTTTTLTVGTNATVDGTLGVTGASTLHALSATTGTFSSTLGVTGTTTLGALTQVGTANINASGASVSTIGTGGTGAVHIGNATGNTAVTGSLTASTGLVATTGGLTATAGNLALNGASGKILINAGTTASASVGTGTLTSGVLTVVTSAATASSLVFPAYINYTSALGGILEASSISGTITITSSDLTDSTSTVQYLIIN